VLIIQRRSGRHQVELNVVAYMWQSNQSIQLSATTISCLCKRDVTVILDLHAPLTAPEPQYYTTGDRL